MSAKIIKASTKRGQELLAKARYYEGELLDSVYDTWSQAKQDAFNYCWDKYCAMEDDQFMTEGFHIISHNTFQFSVAWNVIDRAEGRLAWVAIETATNSYLVDMLH